RCDPGSVAAPVGSDGDRLARSDGCVGGHVPDPLPDERAVRREAQDEEESEPAEARGHSRDVHGAVARDGHALTGFLPAAIPAPLPGEGSVWRDFSNKTSFPTPTV